jgi:hypothetical protein
MLLYLKLKRFFANFESSDSKSLILQLGLRAPALSAETDATPPCPMGSFISSASSAIALEILVRVLALSATIGSRRKERNHD